MKINKFFVATFAVMTIFTSCSKEAGNNPGGGDRTVQIRIDRASSAGTRAEGGQVADNTDVTFTSGYLLFTNAADVVTWAVTVATGDAAYNESAKTVGVVALEAGAIITAVPGNSTKVHLIGNAPSGVTPAVGDTLSSYAATVLSQYSDGTTNKTPKGGVANVTLYGGDALTLVSGGEADEYESEFTVNPIAARFEILAITGTHSQGGANTFEYRVDGVFIDKYYDRIKLEGGALVADLKVNGSTAARYVPGADGSSYTAAMAASVYDYDASGIANQTTFSPGEGVAWTYNLLAPTSAKDGETAASVQMPAIIVIVSNVVVNGTEWPGQFFLTIDKFYTSSAKTTDLAQLAQGNIYVFDNIEFTESNLGIIPYTKSNRVQVEVNMMEWENSEINWEL